MARKLGEAFAVVAVIFGVIIAGISLAGALLAGWSWWLPFGAFVIACVGGAFAYAFDQTKSDGS